MTGFENPAVNLGDQAWNTKVPFRLHFQNGDDAVVIEAVNSSCGCTTFGGSYAGYELAPNESLELDGEVATGLRPGVFTRSAQILLRGGEKFSADLILRVVSTYDITPLRTALGDIDINGETPLTAVSLFTSQGSRLIGAQSDAPWLNVAIVADGDNQSKIVVQARPQLVPFGPSVANVAVSVDDPYRPDCLLSVTARGTAAIRPVPSYVLLRDGTSETVRFLESDGGFAELATAESDAPAVRVAVKGEAITVTREPRAVFYATTVRVTDARGNRSRFTVAAAE